MESRWLDWYGLGRQSRFCEETQGELETSGFVRSVFTNLKATVFQLASFVLINHCEYRV